MLTLGYLALGLMAGLLGGLFGLGGGVIMIPGLVLLFGMSQHKAQGTVVAAMLPPVGLLAFLKYYYAGDVDIKIALWMVLGLLFGGLAGAVCAKHLSDQLLHRLFGGFLMIIAVKMLIGK